MKFTIPDANLLWQAVRRVMQSTPRRTMGTEIDAICVECSDGELYVHRYSGEAYAAHLVSEATVQAEGKVIVGDANLFQIISGNVSAEVIGNDLVITDLTNPRNITKLRLSSTDPFLYTRITSEVKTSPITINLSKCLWMVENENDIIAIDGADVAATNKYNYCLVNNSNVLIDECLCVPREFFLALSDKSQIGTNVEFGNKKVWVIEDNFRYYAAPADRPLQAGYFRSGTFGRVSSDNPQLVVSKDAFSRQLAVVMAMSSDNTYRSGFCSLELKDGELVIDSLNKQIGDSTRIITPLSSSGQFRVINYPKMLLSAVSAIEDEATEITIEAWHSEQHDAYALLIHSDRVCSFIPCASGKGL